MRVIAQFVGSTVRPPSFRRESRQGAHVHSRRGSLRRPHEAARTRDGFDETGERPRGLVEIDELRALQDERTVILREPFGEPELARQIGAIEIERLESLRPNPLDVPAVEELVCDGVEQPRPRARDRRRRSDHRAVAMLHAVAAGIREVVRKKCVVARLVARVLAVDRPLLANDLLDVLDVAVELGIGAGVMEREAEGARADGELPHRDRTEFRGAVHQVLQVRRGELDAIGARRGAAGVQLRGDLPVHAGGLFERKRDRTIVEAARPHERRRHVDVRVRLVDGEVRAVDAIAEHFVLHRHRGAMVRHAPAVRVGSHRRQLAPAVVSDVHVVDVFREIVERVAPGRRAAHAQLERAGAELGEGRLHLHPAVLRFGKRQAIPDRRS